MCQETGECKRMVNRYGGKKNVLERSKYGWTEFENKNTCDSNVTRSGVEKKKLEPTENVNANTLDEGRATTELGVA